MSRTAQKHRTKVFRRHLRWAMWIAEGGGRRVDRLTEYRRYPWPWYVKLAAQLVHEKDSETPP